MNKLEEQKKLLKDMRGYLRLSQFGLAVLLGITDRTFWRWETGRIQPTQKNWKNILELFQQKSKEMFRRKFLESIAFLNGIEYREKSDDEIIFEIKKYPELIKHLQENVFTKKDPDLKTLPFIEGLNSYTKDYSDADARIISSRITEFIRPESWKQPPKILKKVKSINIRKSNIRNRPRERHSQRNKSPTKTGKGGEESDGEGSDEPPGHESNVKQFEPLPFTIPEEGVKEYQELFKKKYAKEINDKDAQQQFSDLLYLINVVYRPINEG